MNLPKYFNCKQCQIAIPILKSEIPYLSMASSFGPIDIMCKKCGKDFEELLLCDHRI